VVLVFDKQDNYGIASAGIMVVVVVKGSRKKNTRLTNNIRPQVVVPKKKHKYKTLSSHCFLKKLIRIFFRKGTKKCALVSKKGLS